MRIAPYSDFHFELTKFPWAPKPSPDADVVVVAGDVYEGDLVRGIRWAAEVADGRACVFVAGNHEFWGRTIEDEIERGAEAADKLGVVFLHGQGWVDVAGARFVGGTLWTDMVLNHAVGERLYAREFGEMIDVRGAGIDRRAKPGDALRWHRNDVEALERALGEDVDDRPRIVVTHHAPSVLCVPPAYQGKPSAAFSASDLEHLLSADVDLWIHGHVHSSLDLVAKGGARMIRNPFGTHGTNPDFVEDLVIDIGKNAVARPRPGA